jgi:hypothetical protein
MGGCDATSSGRVPDRCSKCFAHRAGPFPIGSMQLSSTAQPRQSAMLEPYRCGRRCRIHKPHEMRMARELASAPRRLMSCEGARSSTIGPTIAARATAVLGAARRPHLQLKVATGVATDGTNPYKSIRIANTQRLKPAGRKPRLLSNLHEGMRMATNAAKMSEIVASLPLTAVTRVRIPYALPTLSASPSE